MGIEEMKLYDAARSVPDNAKKTIGAGRLKGMTNINPMWRIERLTEMFGPCGIGWWYEITHKEIVDDEATKQKAAFVDIILYYINPDSGEVSRGIPGTGGASFVAQERNGPYLSDECYKMALTDALSVAAKAIGVGADVYWAEGRSKYDAKPGQPQQSQPEQEPIICEQCGQAIRDAKKRNGEIWSAEDIAGYTKIKYGKSVCVNCGKALANENS